MSGAGKIAVSQTGSFGFPKGIGKSNVELTNNAEVFVAGNGGGSIDVTYGRGSAGDINIKAEEISVGLGMIESFAREGAVGNSGNITIVNTNEIFLGDRLPETKSSCS